MSTKSTKCTDCPYYFKGCDDAYACCHCDDANYAPCSYEEIETPDDYYGDWTTNLYWEDLDG